MRFSVWHLSFRLSLSVLCGCHSRFLDATFTIFNRLTNYIGNAAALKFYIVVALDGDSPFRLLPIKEGALSLSIETAFRVTLLSSANY